MHAIKVDWVEDLVWYDGPLLSIVRSGQQDYLDLWIDVRRYAVAPEGFHYEMDVRCLVKITKADLQALVANQLLLRDAIERSEFILHYVGSLEDPRELKVWTPAEMDAYGCLPKPGTLLRPEL